VEELALLPEGPSTCWSRRLYSSVVSVWDPEEGSWTVRFEAFGSWPAQTAEKIDVVDNIISRKRRIQGLLDAIIA
jgi:hypothetical protein